MIRRARKPMTIPQLKRSMDRRFERVDRRFKAVDRRFKTVDRRFDAVDRRFDAVDRRFDAVDREIARVRDEVKRSAEETRRHFDVVAERLRDEIRFIAEGHALHSQRLDQHETRIERLEKRSF